MFFKTKVCRNKLHIYPEVVVRSNVSFKPCLFSVEYGKVPFPVNDDENDFGVARDNCCLFECCHSSEQKYPTRKSVATNESRNNRTKAILKNVKRKRRE